MTIIGERGRSGAPSAHGTCRTSTRRGWAVATTSPPRSTASATSAVRIARVAPEPCGSAAGRSSKPTLIAGAFYPDVARQAGRGPGGGPPRRLGPRAGRRAVAAGTGHGPRPARRRPRGPRPRGRSLAARCAPSTRTRGPPRRPTPSRGRGPGGAAPARGGPAGRARARPRLRRRALRRRAARRRRRCRSASRSPRRPSSAPAPSPPAPTCGSRRRTGTLPLADGEVDLVWCSEVLEHVADTPGCCRRSAACCARGGRLLVTTPAHGRLRAAAIALARFERHFDPLGGHLRFYTRRSLAPRSRRSRSTTCRSARRAAERASVGRAVRGSLDPAFAARDASRKSRWRRAAGVEVERGPERVERLVGLVEHRELQAAEPAPRLGGGRLRAHGVLERALGGEVVPRSCSTSASSYSGSSESGLRAAAVRAMSAAASSSPRSTGRTPRRPR